MGCSASRITQFSSVSAAASISRRLKDKQLRGQPGGALGGRHQMPGARVGGMAGSQIRQHQMGIAGNDGQNIAEVVRNPARQTCQSLSLLALAQLRFHAGFLE